MRDWDACWREGETPWDKGGAAPPLLDLLESEPGSFLKGARVLVPGCGSGHDVRALAASGAQPVGVDLSPKAVEVAASLGGTGGERYEAGDFLDGGWSGYDAIWEHTCFCAIDPARRADYARSAAEAVRPGGRLFGVFYLDPENGGDGPPFGATREEIIGCFRPWFDFLEGWVPKRTYESRTGREWVAVFGRSVRGVARGEIGG
jgi:SAM-dependent methyltransferase